MVLMLMLINVKLAIFQNMNRTQLSVTVCSGVKFKLIRSRYPLFYPTAKKKKHGFVKNTAVPPGAVTARANTEKHVAYIINTHIYTFLSWFAHMLLLPGGTEWNCSNLPV